MSGTDYKESMEDNLYIFGYNINDMENGSLCFYYKEKEIEDYWRLHARTRMYTNDFEANISTKIFTSRGETEKIASIYITIAGVSVGRCSYYVRDGEVKERFMCIRKSNSAYNIGGEEKYKPLIALIERSGILYEEPDSK